MLQKNVQYYMPSFAKNGLIGPVSWHQGKSLMEVVEFSSVCSDLEAGIAY